MFLFLNLNESAVIHTVIATGNQEGLHLCWTMREHKVMLVPPHTD